MNGIDVTNELSHQITTSPKQHIRYNPTAMKDPHVAQDPMRCIHRIDTSGHAWVVNITRKRQKVQRYFIDHQHGGLLQSLAAAIAWRDAKFAELSSADYVMWRRNVPTPRNTSGVIGVCRGYATQTKKDGRSVRSYYWHAHWTNTDGKRESRQFFVNQHGENKAKQLAIQARKQGMAEVAAEFKARGLTAFRKPNKKSATTKPKPSK